MQRFSLDYYNKSWRANNGLSQKVREKIRLDATLAMVPKSVKTILDVGCGDGFITNKLAEKYRKVVGLDTSSEALKKVKTRTICGTVDSVKIKNSSYNLVCAFEVLEHLSLADSKNTIDRMRQVSNKYILISVPFEESTSGDFTKCPTCHTAFNVFYHLNSFNGSDIKKMFKGYKVVDTNLVGPKSIRWPKWLIYLRQNIGGVWKDTNNTVCPQCGRHKFEYGRGFFFYVTSGSYHLLNTILFWQRKPKWIIALYEKN